MLRRPRLAFYPDANFAKAIDRLAGPEVVEIEELANLDFAVPYRPARPGRDSPFPLYSRLEGAKIDNGCFDS